LSISRPLRPHQQTKQQYVRFWQTFDLSLVLAAISSQISNRVAGNLASKWEDFF
jgi:hypothetical protein